MIMYPYYSRLDNFVESFFFDFKKENRPPVDVIVTTDNSDKDDYIIGCEIHTAAAGYNPDKDLRVWTEGRNLYIEGTASGGWKETGVSSKFREYFKHSYKIGDRLDIDRIETEWKFGILVVKIPIKEKELTKKKYLFGEANKGD